MSEEEKERVCPGCGTEWPEGKFQSHETRVNLKDGSQRNIRFCDPVCCEFWDDSQPGDWLTLADGETEVQKDLWHCEECDSVCEFDAFKVLLDMDYEPARPSIICSSCARKEPDRFIEQGASK